MKSFITLVSFLAVVPAAISWSGVSNSPVLSRRQSSLDTYINTETPIAKAGILANIGPNGSKVAGAGPGVVVAGPSKGDPVNYFYTWIRDSSLVYKLLVDQYTQGRDTTQLTGITNWVSSMTRIQQVSNPSGTVTSGGLGEPKFNVDETAFTGPWGRPQRDGPALRATTAITFGNYLRSHGNTTYATNTLWPMIKLDLDYVQNNWNNTGFDLWEEVNGSSFFTTAVQHRSLIEGAAYATAMGDSARATAYTGAAANVRCFLASYWNGQYAVANVNAGTGRSGLDINTILASIHTFDPAAGCDAATFQPCSDKALLNHKAVVDSFRGALYPINSGIPAGQAVSLGRYKEDVYEGGNPWYIGTFAAAEQLYDALYQWNAAGSITITSVSLPFFQQFSSSITAGTYASSTSQYTTLTSAIKTYADGFLALTQKYIGTNGAIAEQYLRSNGTPASAPDLTWSYASALTAFDARANKVPASWGASGLAVTCATVAVNFVETATTVFGENIFVVGSIPQLGNWSPDAAVPLNANSYPQWKATVNLPAGSTFQYKYIRKNNGAVTWESDPNRQITLPTSGTFTENDTWR